MQTWDSDETKWPPRPHNDHFDTSGSCCRAAHEVVEGISISLILSNVTNFLLANLLIILLDFSFDLYLSHDFSLGSFGLSGSTRLGDLGGSCVGTGAGGGILLGTAFG